MTPQKYIHVLDNEAHSGRIKNCSVFIIFDCSHNAIFNFCQFEFRFQILIPFLNCAICKILPFANCAGKNNAVLCERQASSQHFHSIFKLWQHLVKIVLIHKMFCGMCVNLYIYSIYVMFHLEHIMKQLFHT